MSYVAQLCQERGYRPAHDLNHVMPKERINRVAKGIMLPDLNSFARVFMREDSSGGIRIVYDSNHGLKFFYFQDDAAIAQADKLTRRRTDMSFEEEFPTPKEKRSWVIGYLNLEVLEPVHRNERALRELLDEKVRAA